jgi:hypothetical protein
MTLHELKLQAGVQDNPDQEGLDLFAELLFNEVANTAVISDGMFTGNERRLSVELRLGDMAKKISVFGVEE